jgi:hypothetical protein
LISCPFSQCFLLSLVRGLIFFFHLGASRKKQSQNEARSESEWQRVEVPEWRIIPEKLWVETLARIEEKKALFSSKSCSGMRRDAANQYLLSGLLLCGVCGSRIVIAAGDGKRAYEKYGCSSHRYRGTCSNGLMIRRTGWNSNCSPIFRSKS